MVRPVFCLVYRALEHGVRQSLGSQGQVDGRLVVSILPCQGII